VAFNLGYLPGGDKQLKTGAETTLRALKAASNVLQAGGLISVVAYTGHPGGLYVFFLHHPHFHSQVTKRKYRISVCCKTVLKLKF
jgi:hypothetical protein